MERCPFCAVEIKATDDRRSLRFEVIGFTRDRQKGGTNALELGRRTGTVAHALCVERAKSNPSGTQQLWSD